MHVSTPELAAKRYTSELDPARITIRAAAHASPGAGRGRGRGFDDCTGGPGLASRAPSGSARPGRAPPTPSEDIARLMEREKKQLTLAELGISPRSFRAQRFDESPAVAGVVSKSRVGATV